MPDRPHASDRPADLVAHWLRPDLLALPSSWPERAALLPAAGGPVELTRAAARDAQVPRYLREAGWVAWSAPMSADRAREAVRGRVVVVDHDGATGAAATGDAGARRVTGVQLGELLDALYPEAVTSAPLGATVAADGAVTARLWAPTALDVGLELLEVVEPEHGTVRPGAVLPAARDEASGVWAVGGSGGGDAGAAGLVVGAAYRWVVEVYAPSTGRVEVNHVTDPYSFALTTGSTAGVVVDLADADLAPETWRRTPAPRPARSVDHLVTELHVRDLSRDADGLDPAERGTYRAFTRDIPGTRHLRALAEAGVTTVHLLPVFDIATIEEDRSRWPAAQAVADPAVLAGLDRAGEEQQLLVGEANAIARTFNWGYDPFHVFAPEGSYAVDPHGAARVAEVREMVGALHATGLAVVLDQVYNHTHSCGQDPTSVLCRVVPGYYARLSPTGEVETSTCCPNVATERAMAQRWMVDAVVHWARAYRVDGFRFDLMGHHSRENLLAVRHALDGLSLEEDGVDGPGILLYGEGWSFGEVADDARFVQARQGNLGGTGIATFSDRLRDAVDGGTPSERSTLREPGFATGLGFAVHDGEGAGGDPGGRDRPAGPAVAELRRRAAALLRLGLAGNLRSVRVPVAGGGVVRGDEIPYGDGAAGYADSPDEVVTYVDAHDNETFYDLAVLKLPVLTGPRERVRVNTLGLAAVAWSQTPGFWHAGSELLRSKSLDHDSYDSGDWFNRVDWTGETSAFGSGLPPAWRNVAEWDLLRPLLAEPRLRPSASMIRAAREAAFAVARTRRDVPLLRLGSAELIEAAVDFPEGERTDVVAVLVDTVGLAEHQAAAAAAVDPRHGAALVVLNGSDRETRVSVPRMRGRVLRVAPALAEWAASAGEELPAWYLATGVLRVPPLGCAVLVEPRA
ncbi:MAG: hypothetical protein BGO96_00165 [Micrococcales bacterium 73-15]|uniref:pullulanase-type alpha-1,6-glucosidase n=1 Tax=Salana multivorans TaxID=120377 RepID=UPI0009594BF5|nr:pullulanase-type alpha-1,6-glucosidase [Salana multivorans]OJX93917.1 MAG: hypothetical protein BGO96_00165 [Micrococcales bacterium 73-15]